MKTMMLRTLLAVAALLGAAQAATLTYQGLATDAKGNPKADAAYPVGFAIYSASTGGSAMWSESQSVSTRKGLFTTELGSVTGIPDSLFDGSALYLGVAFDGSAEGGVRQKLGRVPFANRARSSDTSRASRISDSAKSVAGLKDSVLSLRSALAAQSASIVAKDSVGKSHLSDSAKSVAGLKDSILSLRAALAAKDSVRASRKADTASMAKTLVGGGVSNGNFLTYDGTNWVAKNLVVASSGGSQPFSILSPYTVLSFQIALQGIFPSRNGLDPYLGEIMMTGYNFEVKGYAFCNGQLLSIAQNTALFSLLGITYGGNGQTTFGLPDLRGRMPMHGGNSTGPGLSPHSLGEMSGSETQKLTIDQMPMHIHGTSLTTP